MKNLRSALLLCAIFPALTLGQETTQPEFGSDQTEESTLFQPHYVASTLWSLANFLPDAAQFYQLTYGHHFTQKDVFIVEATTWKYNEPLGTYEDSDEEYPGKIRSFGIGLGYQRFHWKNAFTTVEATSFLNQFYDEDDEKIQKGFQLYCKLVLGYRFEFFEKRLFVEPAYALRYWPINTNFPDSFAGIEEGAPNHIIEPSFYVGIRF